MNNFILYSIIASVVLTVVLNVLPIIFPNAAAKAQRKLEDDEQANKLSNVIVENGDVLFNISGASVARCCIVPSEHLPARVNQQVAILRPNDSDISSKFLCCLITSRLYIDRLLGIGDEGGLTRQAITKKQLQDLRVSIPEDVGDQSKICLKLDKLSREDIIIETIYQQKLTSQAELKQSILQKAFAGELTAEVTNLKAEAIA